VDFLAGQQLTKATRAVVARRGPVKAAIAYWGKDALQLLRLNPRRKTTKIICCLQNGKSDPSIIAKFGSRARHSDKLHAKVIWTPTAAIVGSANASSNGLPEEEDLITGLIEAGIYIEDENILNAIESWFDQQFRKAKKVKKADLKRAQIARDERRWGGKLGGRTSKRSFIAAIKGGKKEFLNQSIYFVVFDTYLTRKREKQARSWAKINQSKIQNRVVMPSLKWNWLDYYDDWRPFPKDSYLIDVFYNGRKTTVGSPTKTFHTRVAYDGLEYVLNGSKVHFGYDITAKDKRVIKLASKELSSAAYARSRGGVLPLSVAAPILLKYGKS
jgi:hypothetical protein